MVKMNYYIQDICCLCLQISNEKCSNKSSKYPDNLTPFDKIRTVLLELSTVMSSDNRICLTCIKNVDFIYEFNKTCLKNINILNSYKNVLKENKLKIKCDLFVNLDNSKQLKDTLISEEVEIRSSGSPLTNNYTLCDAGFFSESQSSNVAEVKEEIQIKHENCDDQSELSWLNSKIKIEIEEINKLKQFNENILTSSEVKIEPPESPLNNDDTSNDADYVSKNYSSGLAEVKEEIEINNETCDEELESERSWSDSEIKLEIEDTDLKQEWTNEINDPLMDESSKSTIKDFENNSAGLIEKVVDKEEGNTDLLKDPLLEVAEGKPGEKRGRSESIGESGSCESEVDSDISYHWKIPTHTRKKTHKCAICRKVFSEKGNLNTHMLIHTGEKLYKCDVCGKLFNLKGNLNTHMLIHTDEKLHKCNICGKLFSLKRPLKLHMLTHTGKKPYKCDICDKFFIQKGHFKIHMSTHTGEKPCKCDVCGKLFVVKGTLNKHMLTHTGEKPYKCNICGKLFTQLSSLNVHQLIHTGEKPHKCDVCGKLFVVKGNLNKHMVIHTGEKPHKCDICGKLFSLKGHLKRHMFFHTGEKTHKCDVCGKLFAEKGNLNQHILTHTGKKPHKNIIVKKCTV